MDKKKAKIYVRQLLNRYTEEINKVKLIDPNILKDPNSSTRKRYEYFSALVNKFLADHVIDFKDPNCPMKDSCYGKEDTRFCCKTLPLSSSSYQLHLILTKISEIYRNDILALETLVEKFDVEVTPANV